MESGADRDEPLYGGVVFDRLLRGLAARRALMFELGGAVVLGLALAGLIWALAAPIGRFGEPPASVVLLARPVDLSPITRFDPFFRSNGGALAGPPQSAESLGLKLFALRQSTLAARGRAILSVNNGPQQSFAVGDSPLPGVVLAAVEADHVVFDRAGARLELAFPPRAPAFSAPPNGAPVFNPGAPPANAPPNSVPNPSAPLVGGSGGGPAVAVDFGGLLAQTQLLARRTDDKVTGFRIETTGAAPELDRLGLRRGDVLTAINGVALSRAEALDDLPTALASGQEVTLTYERAGALGIVKIKGAGAKIH